MNSKIKFDEEEVGKTQKKFAEQLSHKTGMSAESIEKDVENFIKRSSESLPEKRKPPYGSVGWYEKFLDIAQSRRLDIVDYDFISMNIAGSQNKYTVLSGLKFLGLVDENNRGTNRLDSLRVIGEEFKKNLGVIIQSAYQNLFSTVVIQRAKTEMLVNFFMQRYNLSGITSTQATRVFVMLCKKAGIELPPELDVKIEGRSKEKKTTKQTREIIERKQEKVMQTIPSSNIVELKLGDIVIRLPKDDYNSALLAKRLLDLHIETLKSS